MATDIDQMPIDGIEDYDQYDQPGPDDTADQDFGALQMFDSNASSMPYSSQVASGQAPEAVMSEDVPSSAPSKKSKRDKKSKKKRKGSHQYSDEPALSPALEDASVKNNPSEATNPNDLEAVGDAPRSDIEPDLASGDAAATLEAALATPGDPAGEGEETVIPSTQTKKKRKLSDSAEGKRRKKRRTRDDEADVVQGTQQSLITDDQAPPTLPEQEPEANDLENNAGENGTTEPTSQNSPSAARLGRSSHARESRRKKTTAKRSDETDQMELDAAEVTGLQNEDPTEQVETEALGEQHHADTTAELLAAQLENEPDVESLAREAWNEHVGSQANGAEVGLVHNGEAADQDVPTQTQYPENELGVYDVPDSPTRAEEPPSTASKKTRATRAKKSKPTYFEQSPDIEESVRALAELPSPAAATPRPRKRKQPASRAAKSAPAAAPEKLSQSMHGASDDDDEDGGRGRRNRMAGYTQGRFSDQELARIRKAVESFRVENDLEQHTVNEMIQAPGGTTAGDTHAQLWVRIFAECPDRHRQKVINITRKKFHNFVARGTWTTDQDTELSDLIRVHGTKWSKIAAIINRHPEDVRDRYRNYVVCGDNQKKDAWDEDEEARLTQFVIEAMQMIDNMRQEQPNRELLQRPYEELIDWQEISEKMGRTRSRLQCITKWKSLNIKTHGKDKLVSKDPESNITFRVEKARRQIAAMDDAEKYRLVLAIRDTAAVKESKIPWQRLCDKGFRSKWHRYTQVLLWKRLKQAIPGWETKSVLDCAQALVEYYNQNGELPDVVDGTYDAAEEMQVVQGIPSSSAPSKASGPKGKNRSAEFVTDSDGDEEQDEEAEGEQNGGTEGAAEADDPNELKIDPALMAQPPSAQKESPALRSPTKEADLFRKTPRKGASSIADPIEDDHEEGVPDPTQDNEAQDEMIAQLQAHSAPEAIMDDGQAPLPGDMSDSVMDDMEDVPARIMATG
ncbi:RNA polymerase I termination factor [Paramyrothecium foliicola]|nr:RNA polymerase I termination factor [Paramyrothecium foliicola]